MPNLKRAPIGTSGKVHDITPNNAGWGYVGFGLYHPSGFCRKFC